MEIRYIALDLWESKNWGSYSLRGEVGFEFLEIRLTDIITIFDFLRLFREYKI